MYVVILTGRHEKLSLVYEMYVPKRAMMIPKWSNLSHAMWARSEWQEKVWNSTEDIIHVWKDRETEII